MRNKKAEQRLVMSKLVTLILVLLVVIAVIIGIWRFGLLDKLKDLFPDFKKEEAVSEETISEQEAIPEKEKDRDYGERYPIVRLYYGGWKNKDDLFAFRWNSNEKKMQVVMNIGAGLSSYIPEKWLINPNLFEAFEKGKGLYGYEKDDVLEIMSSKSEEEMIKEIAKAGERENVYVQFPDYNNQAVSFFPKIDKFDKLNEEEINKKLKEVYAWYYEKNEGEEAE